MTLILNRFPRWWGLDNNDRFWLNRNGCPPSLQPILGCSNGPHGSNVDCCPSGPNGPSGLKIIVSSGVHYWGCTLQGAKKIQCSIRVWAWSFEIQGPLSSNHLRPEDTKVTFIKHMSYHSCSDSVTQNPLGFWVWSWNNHTMRIQDITQPNIVLLWLII